MAFSSRERALAEVRGPVGGIAPRDRRLVDRVGPFLRHDKLGEGGGPLKLGHGGVGPDPVEIPRQRLGRARRALAWGEGRTGEQHGQDRGGENEPLVFTIVLPGPTALAPCHQSQGLRGGYACRPGKLEVSVCHGQRGLPPVPGTAHLRRFKPPEKAARSC